MALMGRSAWWLPRWLDRAMPNLDIEGEKLLKGGERHETPAQPVFR
jgi:hypothetical protein